MRSTGDGMDGMSCPLREPFAFRPAGTEGHQGAGVSRLHPCADQGQSCGVPEPGGARGRHPSARRREARHFGVDPATGGFGPCRVPQAPRLSQQSAEPRSGAVCPAFNRGMGAGYHSSRMSVSRHSGHGSPCAPCPLRARSGSHAGYPTVNHGQPSNLSDLRPSRSQHRRRRSSKQWVGYRSTPFSRLQSPHRSWSLSIVVAPPKAIGRTWSY